MLTTEQSYWRLELSDDCSITVQSIIGQTTYYTLNYYDNAYGTWHNFTITSGQTLKETIEVAGAFLEIRLDEFMANHCDTDDYYLIWAGDYITQKYEKLADGARFTAITPTGYADYKVAGTFVGSVFVEPGQTTKLTFSKEFCTGYERLKVIDDSSEGEAYPDLDIWDYPRYNCLGPYEESSGEAAGASIIFDDDAVVNQPQGFEIVEFEVSDREILFFGLAGWSMLEFRGRELPVKLPGTFVITDYNLEKDENSYGSVRFTTDEDWDYEGHAIDDTGVTHEFYDDIQLQIGPYTVAFWRSKDIGGDYKVEFGTTEINITGRELSLDANDFKWISCVKVEFEFRGLGQFGKEGSRWWSESPEVILEHVNTSSWHELGLDEIVSYAPPIRKTIAYLAPGQYILRTQSGSTPEVINRINVSKNGLRKFIIKDRP